MDAALLALAAVCTTAVWLDLSSVRPILVLATAAIVPGWALLTLLPADDMLPNAALAVALSAAVETIGALILAWSHWWHPMPMGAVLLAISCLLLVLDLRRRGGVTDPGVQDSLPESADLIRPTAVPGETTDGGDLPSETQVKSRSGLGRPGLERPTRSPRAVVITGVALIPLLCALLLWALSLSAIHIGALGKGGLAPALPASWYSAVGVLTLGAAIAAWSRGSSGWLKAAYVAALVVVLYATVPAVTDVPPRAWVYKHVGTTQSIPLHGGVDAAGDTTLDIYDRWPGFFVLASAFSSWARAEPMSFAAWAEPFFALVGAALVAALGFAFGRDAGVAAFAALVFTVTDWVGEAYFAPQAMAFVLALAVLIVFLRAFDSGRTRRWLARLLAWIVRRPQPFCPFSDPLPWSAPASALVMLTLTAALVATHQLTPYALLLQLVALWIIGATKAWWMVLAVAAMTIVYLAPNLGYLERNYGLFHGFALSLGVSGVRVAHLSFLNANAAKLLTASLILMMLGAAILLARKGAGLRAAMLAVLGFAPILIVLAGNQYGGNTSVRLILFALPAWSVLVALGVRAIGGKRLKHAVAIASCGVLVALFVPAFYGLEELYVVQPGEVRASEYFYLKAPAGSVLVVAAPPFPGQIGPRFSQMVGPVVDDQLVGTLLGTPRFQHRALGAADVPAVVEKIRSYSSSGFLVFAISGYRFVGLTELAPPGALAGLEAAVRRSSEFELWYASRDVRIYRLMAPQQQAEPGP